MRRTLPLLAFMLVAACMSEGNIKNEQESALFQQHYIIADDQWKYASIGETGLQLRLGPAAKIDLNKSTNRSYERGLRAAVYSVHPDQFSKLMRTSDPKENEYFAIGIYEPTEWTETIEMWIDSQCKTQKSLIKDKYFNGSQNYWLYEIQSGCSPLRYYFIHRNDIVYKVEATDDTRGYDIVWEVLKNVRFDQ